MVRKIGLMDYDVLRTRYYAGPNYDLGVIYNYLKQDKNLSVHLITSFKPTNLGQYDKIYVFKQSSFIPHPSGYIRNYYKLPIEEYGPGFRDKPLRPFLLETRETPPDCSCYNSMILYSIDKVYSNISWTIDRRYAVGKKYQPIRLYEPFEGEDLKKDYPTSKYCLVYDNPLDILTNKEKLDYYLELMELGHKFLFAHTLDISQLNDTNILEQVLVNSKYSAFKRRMIATKINDNIEWLVSWVMSDKGKKLRPIFVKLSLESSSEINFQTLLLMNYYNHKTNYKLNLIPFSDEGCLDNYTLALLAFKYMTGKPRYMSYYEYVFNIAYLRIGVPKELIHTGEDRYEYIFSHYGMAPLLVNLEEWLERNPQFEEQVFIGGSSNYERQRERYYDQRRSGFNIKSSSNITST